MFFEDNTFEILSLEHDIFYENIRLDSLKYSIMEDIYTENENSAFDLLAMLLKKLNLSLKKLKTQFQIFLHIKISMIN